MTEVAHPSVQGVLVPDSDWKARCHRRLKAALEVLAAADQPLPMVAVEHLAGQREPLTPFDRSLTTSGRQRALINLRWELTGYVHAGLVHNAQSLYKVTSYGREVVQQGLTAQELFDLAGSRYRQWDAARKESLGMGGDRSIDPYQSIVHPGTGAAHTYRAVRPVLDAWRTGESVLSPGASIWSAEVIDSLDRYLSSADRSTPATLPGLDDDDARLLATEMLILLLAPLADESGTNKRNWIRSPLLDCDEPPPLPIEVSADVEHGFVTLGKELSADPVLMLRSFVTLLQHWWNYSPSDQSRAWADPWAWRDLFAAAPKADDRIRSLANVLAHPEAFTNVLREEDRRQILEANWGRARPDRSGDLDRDLMRLVVSLQTEYRRRWS